MPLEALEKIVREVMYRVLHNLKKKNYYEKFQTYTSV